MRKVAQLGSVALVVLALSACGGSGDEAAQTSESTPAGAQTSVAEKPSEQPVVTPVPETEAVPASEAAVTSDTTANDPATSSEEGPAQEDAAEEADRGNAMRRRLMDSTVGADEWSPDLTGAPLVDVEATLQRATDALRAGRLDQAENSALVLFQRVLEGDPTNEIAIKGVDGTVAALLVRADESFAQARFNESARILSVVSKLRPDDPGIPLLKAKLDG